MFQRIAIDSAKYTGSVLQSVAMTSKAIKTLLDSWKIFPTTLGQVTKSSLRAIRTHNNDETKKKIIIALSQRRPGARGAKIMNAAVPSI